MRASATASAKSQSKQTLNQTVSSSHCASAEDLKKQQLDVNSCAACGNEPADKSLKKCPCKMVACIVWMLALVNRTEIG